MSDDFKFFAFIGGLSSVVAVILALACWWGVREYRAEVVCLAYGYPEAKMTWGTAGYCIKRVNQTDVVTPLGDLGR